MRGLGTPFNAAEVEFAVAFRDTSADTFSYVPDSECCKALIIVIGSHIVLSDLVHRECHAGAV